MQFQNTLPRSPVHWLAALMVCVALFVSPLVSLAAPVDRPDIELPVIPPPTNSSARPDPNNIPSEKVTQFVNVYLQVVALIERREGELQAAETESESLRIQHDIETDAIALIETAGLTRQEYLQLLSLVNVDPEFGEQVATLLQETAS